MSERFKRFVRETVKCTVHDTDGGYAIMFRFLPRFSERFSMRAFLSAIALGLALVPVPSLAILNFDEVGSIEPLKFKPGATEFKEKSSHLMRYCDHVAEGAWQGIKYGTWGILRENPSFENRRAQVDWKQFVSGNINGYWERMEKGGKLHRIAEGLWKSEEDVSILGSARSWFAARGLIYSLSTEGKIVGLNERFDGFLRDNDKTAIDDEGGYATMFRALAKSHCVLSL